MRLIFRELKVRMDDRDAMELWLIKVSDAEVFARHLMFNNLDSNVFVFEVFDTDVNETEKLFDIWEIYRIQVSGLLIIHLSAQAIS